MNVAQNTRTTVYIQLGFWDSIKAFLQITPAFLFGILLVGIFLIILFKKDRHIPKWRTSIFSCAMYFYLCIVFADIVGIPTLNELNRLSQLGESFFHPIVNFIPFSDGLSINFLLNIFLFVPFGFLCPMISKTYTHSRNTILLGAAFSLLIEISQLFTLYRASDINDLLANILGTLLGYLCYAALVQLKIVKANDSRYSKITDLSRYLPPVIIALAFVIVFFTSPVL